MVTPVDSSENQNSKNSSVAPKIAIRSHTRRVIEFSLRARQVVFGQAGS